MATLAMRVLLLKSIVTKSIKLRRSINGKTTTRTVEKERQVSTGKYTYYDLWPAESVGPFNNSKDVVASYGYKEGVTLDELINTDVTENEGYKPDGAMKLGTTAAIDKMLNVVVDFYEKTHDKYNGLKNNCADLVQDVMHVLFSGAKLGEEVISNEIGKATTPNQLWKDVSSQSVAVSTSHVSSKEILSNPGQKANTPFLEGVGLSRSVKDAFDARFRHPYGGKTF